MIGVLVIVAAVIAVIAIVNWLRVGGTYDEETIGQIGPEPPGWEPHDVEPWDASPTLYGEKPPKDR